MQHRRGVDALLRAQFEEVCDPAARIDRLVGLALHEHEEAFEEGKLLGSHSRGARVAGGVFVG